MPECCEKYADAVFVYGSNLAARNGKGAALHAKRAHGALRVANGTSGSRAYAIPTKDSNLATLPLTTIEVFVSSFLSHARTLSDTRFYVTAIGTGLAGYSHAEIAPMFKDAPLNCILPREWEPWTRPNQEGDR